MLRHSILSLVNSIFLVSIFHDVGRKGSLHRSFNYLTIAVSTIAIMGDVAVSFANCGVIS